MSSLISIAQTPAPATLRPLSSLHSPPAEALPIPVSILPKLNRSSAGTAPRSASRREISTIGDGASKGWGGGSTGVGEVNASVDCDPPRDRQWEGQADSDDSLLNLESPLLSSLGDESSDAVKMGWTREMARERQEGRSRVRPSRMREWEKEEERLNAEISSPGAAQGNEDARQRERERERLASSERAQLPQRPLQTVGQRANDVERVERQTRDKMHNSPERAQLPQRPFESNGQRVGAVERAEMQTEIKMHVERAEGQAEVKMHVEMAEGQAEDKMHHSARLTAQQRANGAGYDGLQRQRYDGLHRQTGAGCNWSNGFLLQREAKSERETSLRGEFQLLGLRLDGRAGEGEVGMLVSADRNSLGPFSIARPEARYWIVVF